MLLRKRRFKKEYNHHIIKLIFAGSLLVSLYLGLLLVVYLNVHLGDSFISPLSLSKDSYQSSLQKSLDDNKIGVDRISLNSDNSVTVDLRKGGEVIFSGNANIKSQIASLQLMLGRLTIEGKRLKSLDFRYVNPVVSFQ